MLLSHVRNTGVAQPFSGKTSRSTESPAVGGQSFVLPVTREWILRVQRYALETLDDPICLSPFLGASE